MANLKVRLRCSTLAKQTRNKSRIFGGENATGPHPGNYFGHTHMAELIEPDFMGIFPAPLKAKAKVWSIVVRLSTKSFPLLRPSWAQASGDASFEEGIEISTRFPWHYYASFCSVEMLWLLFWMIVIILQQHLDYSDDERHQPRVLSPFGRQFIATMQPPVGKTPKGSLVRESYPKWP